MSIDLNFLLAAYAELRVGFFRTGPFRSITPSGSNLLQVYLALLRSALLAERQAL
jgi:hypothetical protein